MIKNIIFDLGNVLLSFKPELFLANYTKDKIQIDTFIRNIIKSDIWADLDRGSFSLKYAEKKFIQMYPEEIELLHIFFTYWKEMLTPIQDNVELLSKLKYKGYKLYVLSNFIQEAYEFVKEKYNFFSFFDGLVLSCEIKLIKPEIEIFHYLLREYNLIPEDSIFIDDIEQFIEQAKRLNIKTIHYLPYTDLPSELRKFNIDI
ncbi:MAG: HAD family hydrolase [Promethearchaeota archaeon]